jgi:hypothetical protein
MVLQGRSVVRQGCLDGVHEHAKVVLLARVADLACPLLMPLVPGHATVRARLLAPLGGAAPAALAAAAADPAASAAAAAAGAGAGAGCAAAAAAATGVVGAAGPTTAAATAATAAATAGAPTSAATSSSGGGGGGGGGGGSRGQRWGNGWWRVGGLGRSVGSRLVGRAGHAADVTTTVITFGGAVDSRVFHSARVRRGAAVFGLGR